MMEFKKNGYNSMIHSMINNQGDATACGSSLRTVIRISPSCDCPAHFSVFKISLLVPHQKSNKYSEKAFAVVGPRLWNELLTDELRGCNSVDTFKKKLKTMLFKKHY